MFILQAEGRNNRSEHSNSSSFGVCVCGGVSPACLDGTGKEVTADF